jgi:hypothetical protein
VGGVRGGCIGRGIRVDRKESLGRGRGGCVVGKRRKDQSEEIEITGSGCRQKVMRCGSEVLAWPLEEDDVRAR